MAKAALQMALDNSIKMACGRCLVKIFLCEDDLADKSKSLNKLLIREHLAYSYHGGTKNNDFKTYFYLDSSAYI